jgi:hypothetical protein
MAGALLARVLQIHDALSEIELATMALVGEAEELVDNQIRAALESIRVARETLAKVSS